MAALLMACSLVNPASVPVLINPTAPAPAAGSGANGVALWTFPDDDAGLLLERISAGRKRVFMTMYLLTDPRVIEALKNAQNNGADVRVLIEAEPVGGGASARAAIDKLTAAGLPVKTSNPAFRLTHEKSFVIDDSVIILTANMTRSSFTRNREFAVAHNDPGDVAEVTRQFNADWAREAFEPAQPNLVWSPVNARERINALIDGAANTLIIYAASALDDDQIGRIAAAGKRGVAVRVMTSPARPNGEEEPPGAQDLDKLQRARVKVRLLKSPIVHAKAFVADDRLAFVGSVNITTQSLDFNRELGILLADRAAIERIALTFENDWGKALDR